MLVQNIHCRLLLQPFRKVTVYHSLIGHPLGAQGFLETAVQGEQYVPNLEEALLHRALLIRLIAAGSAKVGYETLHGLLLGICQVGEIVLHPLILGHVREKAPGRNQVLVHIVEVSQQDVAPEYEIVQGLRSGVEFLVAVIEGKQKVNPVHRRGAAYLVEEIVHRKHPGGDNRPSALPDKVRQPFLEKQLRTPVWEYKAETGYLTRGEIMLRHLPQERFHGYRLRIASEYFVTASLWEMNMIVFFWWQAL